MKIKADSERAALERRSDYNALPYPDLRLPAAPLRETGRTASQARAGLRRRRLPAKEALSGCRVTGDHTVTARHTEPSPVISVRSRFVSSRRTSGCAARRM